MPEFYHVARVDIGDIKILNLEPIEKKTMGIPPMYTNEEVFRKVEELYGPKISRHGKQYLYEYFHYFHKEGFVHVDDSQFIETTFELVRLLNFKKEPSRFTSIFASETLADAERIRSAYFRGVGDIYLVECETFFKADLNYLRVAGNYIGTILMAEKYWSGQSSDNPIWEILMQGDVRVIEKVV